MFDSRGLIVVMGRSKTANLESLDHPSKDVEMTSLGEKSVHDDEGDNDVGIEDGIQLKRELGIFGGISFIIGTIVGSGIFVSPKGVLDVTGSVGLSLVVWTGAGLIALMGSLCYSELGTLIKKSGGEYTYIRKAYGNFPAFLCSWVSLALVRPSSLAIMALTFGTYFATVFDTCGTPDLIVKLAAVCCLLTVMLLNCYSIKMSARLQITTTTAKVAALFIIIVGGIYEMIKDSDNTKMIRTGFEGSTTDPVTISLAFYDALWAYDGWNNLNVVTEELQNPNKNLPRANIISVLSVIIIYALTNICYLTVMTKQELLDADAVAVLWGDRVLGSASIIIPLAVMISTFGSVNGTAFSGGRQVFAASRDGNLPELLSFVNVKQNTPLTSMLFTNIVAIVFVMLGDISSLVDFFNFTAWLFYGLTFGSLIVFRFKFKDEPRPYKAPIILPALLCLISIYLIIAPIVQNPSLGYLYAVLFTIGGAVLYVPLVHYQLKVPGFDQITTYFQLILEISPTKKVE